MNAVDGPLVGPSRLNRRDDIEVAVGAVIKHATSYLYLENQYFRDVRLAAWIIDRVGKNPDLRVLIVTPVAPEELTQPGSVNPITAKGMFLQRQTLTRLRDALGANLGMDSMVEPEPRPGGRLQVR